MNKRLNLLAVSILTMVTLLLSSVKSPAPVLPSSWWFGTNVQNKGSAAAVRAVLGAVGSDEFNTNSFMLRTNGTVYNPTFSGSITGLSTVTIIRTNGTINLYAAAENSDAGRGTNLSIAMAAMVPTDQLIVPGGNYLMHRMNNLLLDDCTYTFQDARLYIDSLSVSVEGGGFDQWLLYSQNSPNKSRWRVNGPLTLDGRSIAGKYGMVLQGGQRRIISDVVFANWQGYGFWVAGGTEAGNQLVRCYASNCVTGFYINGEYWKVAQTTAFGNTNGIRNWGGNNRYDACSAQENRVGFSLEEGGNSGHGVWIGGDLNHNLTNVWCASNYTHGFTFLGAHSYSGQINIGGAGFTWTGGDIAGNIVCQSGVLTNLVVFSDVTFPQGESETYLSLLSTANRAYVRLINCKTLTRFTGDDNVYFRSNTFDIFSFTNGMANFSFRDGNSNGQARVTCFLSNGTPYFQQIFPFGPKSNLLAAASITIGASPSSWTNTNPYSVVAYIDGVSVTGTVGVNGGTVFNTIGQNTILLGPSEYVTITYTIGTPTANWKPF